MNDPATPAPAPAVAGAVDLVLRSDAHGIATLTLNRPEKYNALSVALLDALQTALDDLAADESVRVVVIAGAGKAFCAGHDLREMRAAHSHDRHLDLFGRCARMMTSIVALPQPVIARVHGTATAAGCQLVATCDLAVASTAARFAVSGVNLGLFCSTPSVALARNVPRKQAFEMLVTGQFIDAHTAVARGLVNRAVAPEALDEAVGQLAQVIAGKPPVAVAMGKRTFYQQLEMGLENAYDIAGRTMSDNMMLPDTVEGVDAFLEKREPRWRGP